MQAITINTDEIEPRLGAMLIMQIVIPRPIALISTIDEIGNPNLAPFSYFQVVSGSPLAVGFSVTRDRQGNSKQTLTNSAKTREFVAAMVTEQMAEAMNIASAAFPPRVSEFEKAGFTEGDAGLVKPKLIAEAPVNLECKVINIIELSDRAFGGSFVIGIVKRIHFKKGVYDADAEAIQAENYNLVSRLGGTAYGTVRDQFDMPRPKINATGEIVR